MSGRDTRKIILEKSLILFSERGYDGVSVRDIAREVGIRESALYKHFGGKQDLFDSLFIDMKKRYEDALRKFDIPLDDIPLAAVYYGENGIESVVETAKLLFLFWLRDEYAAGLRRMLTVEQFRNAGAAATYRSFFMDDALAFHRRLFGEMIRKKYFPPGDPDAMALQFYAPFFLLFSRYDGQPEKEEEALCMLEKHVRRFAALYAPVVSADS